MTCAKVRVFVTLTHPDGRSWTGENWCKSPQTVCPRLPSEDYTKCKTICDQTGHAELDALRLAGPDAKDCIASLKNHTYFCQPCQHALFGAGVVEVQAKDCVKGEKDSDAWIKVPDIVSAQWVAGVLA